MNALVIPLEKIGPDGLDLDVPLPASLIAGLLGPKATFEAIGDGRLTVRLEKAGDAVHVRGRMQVKLRAPCGRCVEPLDYQLGTEVEVALFPLGKEPPAAPDGEVAEEDLGVATYEGDEVDLTSIVRDEVFLEMPMSSVCSYEDPTACPNYVAMLAQRPPQPAEEKAPDPRWAALKGIKLS